MYALRTACQIATYNLPGFIAPSLFAVESNSQRLAGVCRCVGVVGRAQTAARYHHQQQGSSKNPIAAMHLASSPKFPRAQ